MNSSIDYAFEVHKLKARKGTKVAAVIPAFNEGPRISKVLEIVVNFPVFDEIILINDGSKDKTLDIMNYYANRSSKIKVVNIQPNKGKTNAVKIGVSSSTSELICLIDADLTGLKYDYLYKMIYYILSGEYQMTILDRAGDRMGPLGWSTSWVIRFIGGERAFWKKEFQEINFGKNSKYAIEQEINIHYIEKGLNARTIYCPDLIGEYQWNKKGLINSLKSYATMTKEIYSHSKMKTFYYQVENIVEDRIEPLYLLLNRTKVKKPIMGAILLVGLLGSISSFLWLNIKKRAIR